MPRRSSRDRVQVGLHHTRHPAETRAARELGRATTVAAAEVAQCLDGDVDTHFVAVPEAVGDSLGGRIDADIHTFHAMDLDALCQREPRGARHPQARVVEPGSARLFRQRYPHLGWCLARQLVEAQRCQQAENGGRYLLGNNRERVLSGEHMLTNGVHTSGVPLDQPLAHQPIEPAARDAVRFQLSWPNNAQLPDGAQCLVVEAVDHGECMIQNVGD